MEANGGKLGSNADKMDANWAQMEANGGKLRCWRRGGGAGNRGDEQDKARPAQGGETGGRRPEGGAWARPAKGWISEDVRPPGPALGAKGWILPKGGFLDLLKLIIRNI